MSDSIQASAASASSAASATTTTSKKNLSSRGKGGRGGDNGATVRGRGRGGVRGGGQGGNKGRGGTHNNGGRHNHHNNPKSNDNGGFNQTLKEETPSSEAEPIEAMEHHHCLVCYSPTLHQTRGITPCNHDTICSLCHLRLRSLLNDKRCPICKTTNDTIIVDADHSPTVTDGSGHKKFNEYERWGDNLGPNFIYREDVQMFFPTRYYYQYVLPLFSLKCNVRNCNYGNNANNSNNSNSNNNNNNSVTLKGLNHHLAAAHSMSLCQLCVDNKRDFISRLPRFTQNQLNDHNKYGDNNFKSKKSSSSTSNPQTKGHPLCQFCAPTRFYDLTALHEHLNKEHYKCHVCDKLGIFNQFFRDYQKLNMHFDKEHYLCHHPDCLAARFVVFQNDIDLIAHERDVHRIINNRGSQRSTKIHVEFQYRRENDTSSSNENNRGYVPDLEEDFNYGLNGEVFVPEAIDQNLEQSQQENEPQITHGPHAERTALLREQARRRREELGIIDGSNHESGNEAFPALNAGSDSASATVGWATGSSSTVAALRGRNPTQLTEENFPSLGGVSRPKSNVSSKLRATTSSISTRSANSGSFATSLMTTSRNNSSHSFSYSNHINPNVSASNLTVDNFPTLGSTSYSRSTTGTTTATTSNPYAAAQAFAKKNLNRDNFPSLGSVSTSNNQFPALSSSTPSTKKKTINNIFSAKKPPALDNILDFPSPPSLSSSSNNNTLDGKAQVDKMKKELGQAKYKELKKLTKSFALNELDPESYVSSAIKLFEKGMEDSIFWETVPNLISSSPNESNAKRAKRYLESLRYPTLMNQTSATASKSNLSTAGSGWSDHVNSIHASFQKSSKTKQKSVWGSGSGGKVNTTSKIGKSVIAAAAASSVTAGTATKYMAKEREEEKKLKQLESEALQGNSGKKKKSNAKKNELRDLAFGKKY